MLFGYNMDNNKETKLVKGVRHSAVKILNRYERSGSYLDKLISNEIIAKGYIPEDKSLLTELVYGVVRWKLKLDWVLTGFFHGDYNKCLNFVKNSMRVGLYQVMMLDKIPNYAAIDESVEIVKLIQGDKTAGLVNGVLRNIVRNLENIRYPDPEQDYFYNLGVRYSHPKWLVKRWVNRFGEPEAIELMNSFNNRPDTTFRINRLITNLDEIKGIFEEKGINYEVSAYLQDSILLKTPNINVPQTELFKAGKISIQDTSSSLACVLANPKPGMKIVDLCSAPGGKATYMAELAEDKAEIIANDLYEVKLPLIQENISRLGLKSVKTKRSDAKKVMFEFDSDIVFIDAPCSGIGTIRKHPEIKWSVEYDNIVVLVKTQRQLLSNAAKLVKSGGVIIYSTCTITPEENEENVEWFLEKNPNFYLDNAENYLHKDLCRNGMMHTFPHLHKMDGAFAARLVKK